MQSLRAPFALVPLLVASAAWSDEVPASATPTPAASSTAEEICDDKVDNDGDAVTDCGDSDCAGATHCKVDGSPENTAARCSDWIDNDGDGIIDCEDKQCQQLGVCQGSWHGPVDGSGSGADVPSAYATGRANGKLPEDVEGADSEDGLGFIGVRFGIVAQVVQSVTADNKDDPTALATTVDTEFNRLQLRAFGALPYVEDSFFLINVAAEKSPRVTFAMFQFPLGNGHAVNINSGGGTLSNQLIVSTAKLPLLQTANYMLSAFEQGNGVSTELSGPIIPGMMRYRVYAAGGAGIPGVVGGRRFRFDTFNYTWGTGAQLQYSPIGNYNRFETPFLYKPVPMQLAFNVGAKFEQRALEMFPATNVQAIFRMGLFEVFLENYSKMDLAFGAAQTASNAMVGVLLWPETLFLAADVGHFTTTEFGWMGKNLGIAELAEVPSQLGDIAFQRNEVDVRAALHWYFWRQNGILSTRYVFKSQDPVHTGLTSERGDPILSHEGWLSAQFRF